MSRVYNSVKNVSISLIEQVVSTLVLFLTRTIFIYCLGKTYLGLSGLFSDILTLLSLADLGFGTAIVYSMYKPMANNDFAEVNALLIIYKKIYYIVGCLMTLIGLALTPYLKYVISDMPNIPEINIIYILYLLNTTTSYFFSYKKCLLMVDQKAYIISLIQLIVNIIQNILQIVILLLFHNFLLYLGIQISCTLLNNIVQAIIVNRRYTFILTCKKKKLSQNKKEEIIKNVSSMFLSKVSSVIVTSTDNILISKYVSTIVLGLYSNYVLFVNLIRMVFTRVFEGITGSLGNLLALESNTKAYFIFKRMWFANFWLISFCSITLYIVINPFVEIWLGESFLLYNEVVFLICFNMYMRFIRNTQLSYIDAYGLYWNIKWKAIIEASINLGASIFFLKFWDLGIIGVLLGTTVSNFLTNFWYEPYIVYKYCLKQSVMRYFITFIKYIVITFTTAFGIQLIISTIKIENQVMIFIVDLLICVVGINILYVTIFRNTDEFKYYCQLGKNLIEKISGRGK